MLGVLGLAVPFSYSEHVSTRRQLLTRFDGSKSARIWALGRSGSVRAEHRCALTRKRSSSKLPCAISQGGACSLVFIVV